MSALQICRDGRHHPAGAVGQGDQPCGRQGTVATREANGWSRKDFVARLPSGIGDRALLSYEHGTRQLTLLRFIELCRALGVAGPVLLQRALQRAHRELETLVLKVDLHALVNDRSSIYPHLVQWAHNTLIEIPEGGVVDLEPAVARNLARCFGCDYQELTRYLSGFLADEMQLMARPKGIKMATEWLGIPSIGLPTDDKMLQLTLQKELQEIQDDLDQLTVEVIAGSATVESYRLMAQRLTDLGIRLWGEGQRLSLQRRLRDQATS